MYYDTIKFIIFPLAVSFFTLGKRLGALNIGNVPARCQEIIDATQIMFASSQKAAFAPPLHKIYPTKLWKSLLSSQDKVKLCTIT